MHMAFDQRRQEDITAAVDIIGCYRALRGWRQCNDATASNRNIDRCAFDIAHCLYNEIRHATLWKTKPRE